MGKIDEILTEKQNVIATEQVEFDELIQEINKEAMELLENRNEIPLEELLQYKGREFVDYLYKTILKRKPDPEGRRNTALKLYDIKTNRLDIIEQFVNSPEGQSKGMTVIGLDKAMKKLNLKRHILSIPILGYILRWIKNVLVLPRTINSMEQEIQNAASLVENLYSVNEYISNEIAIKDQVLCEQQVQTEKNNQLFNQLYYDYEHDLMQRDREELKDLYYPYLDRIIHWTEKSRLERNTLRIVDLGCGGCEWLEVLHNNGYCPIGVDSNNLILNEIKQLKPELSIICEDAIGYLHKQKTNSLDVISCFQMVEHLDLLTLYNFFDECKRVLRKDGLLIIATPDARNILTATYMFRVDPTHKNPIPIEVMEFYMRRWNFTVIDSFDCNPMNYIPYDFNTTDPVKDIVYRFNKGQDYSVWAVNNG